MIKISIITTSFNAAETIRDCLESVKNQTHDSIEHLVVDAASTDGTLDILEEYKETLARVISEPDKGIYDGMNKGLQLATGDVVGILNADDMYHGSDILARVARVFEDDNIDACYGDLVYISVDKDGSKDTVQGAPHPSLIPSGARRQCCTSQQGNEGFRILRYWKSGEFDSKKFYWGWMPPHPTFFVRRSVYEKYGSFNLELGTAADYELMLRFLLKHCIPVAYLPQIFIKMRSGGASNVTLESRLKANRMDRKAWDVNGLKPYPWTLLMKPMRKIGQWFSKPGF